MKKNCNLCLLALVIGFAFLLQNCQEEDSTILKENVISTELSSKNDKDKIDVCHLDKKTGVWNLINISKNAIPEHKLIGDIIIDEDGDGFALENECGLLNENGIDCDDTNELINPNAEKICGNGIDNNCDKIDDCLTFVPDDNFENYLETHAADGTIVAIGASNSMGNGINNDNYVLTSNINTIYSLAIAKKEISELTGIEDFIALNHLYCNDNQLTSLDLSGKTALTALFCHNNALTGLDVSESPALIELLCYNNALTSLDVSGMTALTALHCFKNYSLTSLDASGATALRIINCSISALTSLDVSGTTALTTLYCNHNQLTSLDVSESPALTNFVCYVNPLLTCIQVNNDQFSSIPSNWHSDAAAIYLLDCSSN